MASPLFMRDVTLTLKVLPAGPTRVEFNCDVHLAEIVPEPGDEVTYQTLCPTGSYKSVGKTAYSLHIVAAQRWDSTGLASFLWDNDGADAEFQYNAHAAGVPSATTPGMAGIVRLIAGNYGGEADTYAELDVTLPCQTKPTKVVAAFPTAIDAETGEPIEEPAGETVAA